MRARHKKLWHQSVTEHDLRSRKALNSFIALQQQHRLCVHGLNSSQYNTRVHKVRLACVGCTMLLIANARHSQKLRMTKLRCRNTTAGKQYKPQNSCTACTQTDMMHPHTVDSMYHHTVDSSYCYSALLLCMLQIGRH